METPLTPLEFARRTRALYPDREALVDGALRLSYAQFFDRCDRWSAALQRLGVAKGDRVAYIAPNTHAQLESYYAVPQIGAVLVPINYRLSVDEFVYIIEHSGASVLCAHPDYLEGLDGVRDLQRVVSRVAFADKVDSESREMRVITKKLVSLVLGIPASYAMSRYKLPFAETVRTIVSAPTGASGVSSKRMYTGRSPLGPARSSQS